jgi:hypothetical protein
MGVTAYDIHLDFNTGAGPATYFSGDAALPLLPLSVIHGVSYAYTLEHTTDTGGFFYIYLGRAVSEFNTMDNPTLELDGFYNTNGTYSGPGGGAILTRFRNKWYRPPVDLTEWLTGSYGSPVTAQTDTSIHVFFNNASGSGTYFSSAVMDLTIYYEALP